MRTATPTYRCTGCSRDYVQADLARCPICLGRLYALPAAWAGHPVTNAPRRPRVVPAQALRGERFRRRPAGDVMAAITGVNEVPYELTLVVTGPPAAGKSTLLIALLEDGTWGAPLLASAEEGLGVSVADRLARAEAVRTSVTDASGYAELATLLAEHAGEYDVLAIDSLTSARMTMSELGALRRHYGVSLIGVAQTLKDGRFAGAQSLLHDADLFVAAVAPGQVVVRKSWFSEAPRSAEISPRGDAHE